MQLLLTELVRGTFNSSNMRKLAVVEGQVTDRLDIVTVVATIHSTF